MKINTLSRYFINNKQKKYNANVQIYYNRSVSIFGIVNKYVPTQVDERSEPVPRGMYLLGK